MSRKTKRIKRRASATGERAQAIENEFKHVPDLPTILRYHQRRNHAAYCSHRKRIRTRLDHNRRKPKVLL